jgi:hypothetical protein
VNKLLRVCESIRGKDVELQIRVLTGLQAFMPRIILFTTSTGKAYAGSMGFTPGYSRRESPASTSINLSYVMKTAASNQPRPKINTTTWLPKMHWQLGHTWEVILLFTSNLLLPNDTYRRRNTRGI